MNLADYTWHCLYCPPGRELIVCHDLWMHGHPGIVPAEKQWAEKRGHTRVTYKAVMPRYVFTGFKGVPNFETLRLKVPIIQGYMEFGNGPAVLKLEDMQWLYDLREQLRNRQRPVEAVIRIGDKVRVIHGPLNGQMIGVEEIVAKRIHTIREFLGAPRLFKVPLAHVARIS